MVLPSLIIESVMLMSLLLLFLLVLVCLVVYLVVCLNLRCIEIIRNFNSNRLCSLIIGLSKTRLLLSIVNNSFWICKNLIILLLLNVNVWSKLVITLFWLMVLLLVMSPLCLMFSKLMSLLSLLLCSKVLL